MTDDHADRLTLPDPTQREANEPIRGTSLTLGDFWRWYASDLSVNTTRGSLAEFIIARALGDTRPIRVEWDDYDALCPDGTRVEVKSSGYLQRWRQVKPSAIRFGGFAGKAWDEATGTYSSERSVRADVFVFAIETCEDPAAYDPLDISQWEFYVVSGDAIRASGQRSGGLAWVRRLAGGATPYQRLPGAVAAAARSVGPTTDSTPP